MQGKLDKNTIALPPHQFLAFTLCVFVFPTNDITPLHLLTLFSFINSSINDFFLGGQE